MSLYFQYNLDTFQCFRCLASPLVRPHTQTKSHMPVFACVSQNSVNADLSITSFILPKDSEFTQAWPGSRVLHDHLEHAQGQHYASAKSPAGGWLPLLWYLTLSCSSSLHRSYHIKKRTSVQKRGQFSGLERAWRGWAGEDQRSLYFFPTASACFLSARYPHSLRAQRGSCAAAGWAILERQSDCARIYLVDATSTVCPTKSREKEPALLIRNLMWVREKKVM